MSEEKTVHTVLIPQVSQYSLSPFVKALVDAGVIPDKCRRVVIDCKTGSAIMVHYEVFVDQRINDQPVLDAIFELGVAIKADQSGVPLAETQDS